MRPLSDDLGVDGVKPQVSPHRAIVVALATGSALLLLAVSIFSVINEAKSVSAQSAELQAADEALRSAVIVRSQLATAANFAALTVEAQIDGTEIVERSIIDTKQSMVDLEVSLEALQAQGFVLPAATQESIDGFTRSANEVLELLESNQGPLARDVAAADLVPSFDAAVLELNRTREGIADALETTDSQLGRLGNLASFVIAFLIPTVAAFVYQQITRRSKETVTIAHSLESERTLALWREALIDRSLASVAIEPRVVGDALVSHKLESVRFIVAATQSGYRYRTRPTNLEQIFRNAATGLPPSLNTFNSTQTARLDEKALSRVISSLIIAAHDRGATSVTIHTETQDQNYLKLIISDNGPSLDQAAIERVLAAPMLSELDQSDLASTGLAILLAKMVTEAHQGTVSLGGGSASTGGTASPNIELRFVAEILRSGEDSATDPVAGTGTVDTGTADTGARSEKAAPLAQPSALPERTRISEPAPLVKAI